MGVRLRTTTRSCRMTVTDALADLTEPFPDELLPPLDRRGARCVTPEQQHWHDHGYVIYEQLIPDELLDAYEDAWLAEHGKPILVAEQDEPLGYVVDTDDAGGWPDATPYMRCAPLRDLVCSPIIAARLEHLIGEPLG